MNTRRLKRLSVTPEFIVKQVQGTYRVVANPLPEDIVIMSSNYNPQRDEIEIILQSEQWPEVGKGRVIPVCDSPFIERLERPEPPPNRETREGDVSMPENTTQ